MKMFLSFDKMITPIIIKIAFWAGVFVTITFSVFLIGFGILSSSGNILFVFLGLITFLVGPVLIRIYCEMLIVFFKVQEALVHIREIVSDRKEFELQPKEHSVEVS